MVCLKGALSLDMVEGPGADVEGAAGVGSFWGRWRERMEVDVDGGWSDFGVSLEKVVGKAGEAGAEEGSAGTGAEAEAASGEGGEYRWRCG